MAGKALVRHTTDPRHLLRFLKSEAGMAPKDIAKAEGVSLATVKQSILQIESYRKRNSGLEMDLAVRDLVISSIPKAKETLDGLLAATELVERKNPKTGQTDVVKVEDKTTRLEAMRLLNALVIGLQPKNPAVEVNVSQTNQTASFNGAESNEERFRRLRKKAEEHNRLPAEVAGVPEYIDAGLTGQPDADDDDDDIEDAEEVAE